MLKITTLDKKKVEPLYPYTEWSLEAERKWAMMVGKISLAEPFERELNSDGTVTFRQEQGPPAMRIFRTP